MRTRRSFAPLQGYLTMSIKSIECSARATIRTKIDAYSSVGLSVQRGAHAAAQPSLLDERLRGALADLESFVMKGRADVQAEVNRKVHAASTTEPFSLSFGETLFHGPPLQVFLVHALLLLPLLPLVSTV